MKAISRELGGYMSNKEELLEAIEHYDVLTKKHTSVLKVLVKISEDDIANITIKKLAELSNSSKPVVYQAINNLEERKMIEKIKANKGKFSQFILKPLKLEEIIKYSNKIKLAQ